MESQEPNHTILSNIVLYQGTRDLGTYKHGEVLKLAISSDFTNYQKAGADFLAVREYLTSLALLARRSFEAEPQRSVVNLKSFFTTL